MSVGVQTPPTSGGVKSLSETYDFFLANLTRPKVLLIYEKHDTCASERDHREQQT